MALYWENKTPSRAGLHGVPKRIGRWAASLPQGPLPFPGKKGILSLRYGESHGVGGNGTCAGDGELPLPLAAAVLFYISIIAQENSLSSKHPLFPEIFSVFSRFLSVKTEVFPS